MTGLYNLNSHYLDMDVDHQIPLTRTSYMLGNTIAFNCLVVPLLLTRCQPFSLLIGYHV